MQRMMKLGVIALLLTTLPSPVEPAPPAKKKKTNPDYVQILPSNDRFIAIDKKNGSIVELGLPDMEVRKNFKGDDGRSIVFHDISPDAKWLLAAYKKGQLWVWDINTGEAKLRVPIKVSAFSPLYHTFVPRKNELIIYDPGENKISTWHIPSGELTDRPFSSLSTSGGKMALSPDGKHLVLIGNLYYNYSSYNIGVFSYPGGRSLGRIPFMDLVLAGKQKGGGYTFETHELAFESNQVLSMIVEIGHRNDKNTAFHQMTVSIPQLTPTEDVILAPESVVQWSVLLPGNQKALLQKRIGDIKTDDNLVVVRLNDDGQPIDPIWRIYDQGFTLTSHDVSSDAGWAVVGSKETRSLYVYDTRKLKKREKTISGNRLEWMEPVLVKSMRMP